MSWSLDELASAVADSDADAFEALFERLREPLFRYVRELAPSGDGYDVLQDVFLKLWEVRSRLEVRVGIKPLLYRMARNRALNMTRKLKRIRLPGDLPDSGQSPEGSTVELNELQEQIQDWIGQLPPRRAEAFLLSRFHELPHADIARIMNLSVRTVQTHIVHALKDLRAARARWEATGRGPQ
ncbi:MAG: sigma-70 family RNA polymerase sigma factor [Rhodothermales bacterium]|nr:sigma-70 family RNA polymerase sigma factor [Rhodothermales bacterium]